MSMFTLAISCLTMSNLPWFMDLTFQVPTQYCSLQHLILFSSHIHNWVFFLLLPSCFILSEAISDCLLLFPSSVLDTFQSGGAHLLVSYLFAFSYCPWNFQDKNTGAGYHFILQWTTFSQNSSLSVLGGPAQHGSQLHWDTRPLSLPQGCDHEVAEVSNSPQKKPWSELMNWQTV